MTLNDNSWESKFSLSKLLFEEDQFDKAIALLEEVIQIHHEPEMDLHLGVYYSSKGEQIGKETVNQMGYYDEEKVSSIASPYMKKAVYHLDKFRKNNAIDNIFFNDVCNMFDQLSPGSLQEMKIPLSLARIHRVLIGDCRIDPPQEIMEAEFVSNKTIKSAFLFSCVAGTTRSKAQIYLYETADTEKITSGNVKPCAEVYIGFPGFDDPSVPTCQVSEH